MKDTIHQSGSFLDDSFSTSDSPSPGKINDLVLQYQEAKVYIQGIISNSYFCAIYKDYSITTHHYLIG